MARQMTKWWIGGLLATALIGAGWYLLSQPDPAETPAYSSVKLHRGDLSAVVSATGTLGPLNLVQVGSQVSGTIQHLYADFNDKVERGQIIAQIDPAIFKAKRAEALATLQSAEAERDKAQVSVLDAKREFERQSDLFKRKLSAESLLDAARFAYETAQAEYQVKLASLAQSKAALEREQVNLDYTTIYAPIDGVVISRDVDVGQTVAASLQAPTLFSIADDLTHMQVEADVDEAFIGQVEQDQPVSFTVFAYPERKFMGKVSQVRLQPKVDAGVVKYNCIIHVENEDQALKPGMTATVSIEVSRSDQVLIAPNAALRFVPAWPAERLAQVRKDLKSDRSLLWRVDGEVFTPVMVTTGIVGEKETEVSGEGLVEGMSIAVPGKRQEGGSKRRFGLSLF